MARCYSTLVDLPQDGFAPQALRLLADGRAVPFQLNFTRADLHLRRNEGAGCHTLSISGVQEKVGLDLIRGRFVLAEATSRYILKPIPTNILCECASDIPANEHLTMQIAAQIFGITTAANACLKLADGEYAYLTRRFDYRNGQKILQEDFCQIAARTEQTHGHNYKYDCSYEEMGEILRTVCATYKIEVVKFFRIVLFNYLIGNGDAHMKNFSLMQMESGEFALTPAYDLLNTKMHFPAESSMALDLFKDGFATTSFEENAFYRCIDFEVFGQRLGIPEVRIKNEIDHANASLPAIRQLVQRSFLTQAAQVKYLNVVEDRIRALS